MRVEAKGGVRVQAGPGTSCPSLPITLAIAQPQPMHVPAPPGGGGAPQGEPCVGRGCSWAAWA